MTARLSVLLSLCCGLAFAQMDSITGTVTNSVDSSPIAGAVVTLGGPNGSQAVLTDAGGKFTFGVVPAGGYTLSATRNGYPISNMQRPLTAYVNVVVPGKADPVILQLTPGAKLTGSVTDEAGFPLPNASVELIHREVSGGRGRLVVMTQTGANDLGEFRTTSLAADRYLVCVNAYASSYQRHHGLTYPTTCFPGVTDPSAAQWVNLGPGEERKVAFHLAPVPGVRISGSVANAGKGTFVSIRRTDPPGFPQMSGQFVAWDEKTSTFEILAVSPGDYLITANQYGAGGQNLRAMRAIHVGTEDIRDVNLTMRDGPYLAGTVRMGDAPSPPQNQVYVGIVIDKLVRIQANASGSFKQAITEPGDYSVAVAPLPGWSLQAITQGGVDIRDRKLAIGANADPEPIEIVLGHGGGTIEVSFQSDSTNGKTPLTLTLLRRLATESEWALEGQPVFAVGSSIMRNIPPGDYSIFAWPGANQQIEYLSPAVLEKYRSFGQSVSVRESETTRVTVTPVPIE